MNHLGCVSRCMGIGVFGGIGEEDWEMRAAVVLSESCLVAMVVVCGWGVEAAQGCDTKWIRLVYMMSCGKKKRESVWAQNDTFYENLPSDFDGAFRYYKEKDPFNPLFNDALFYEMLQEDGREDDGHRRVEQNVPKLLIFGEEVEEEGGRGAGTSTDGTPRTSSVLMRKLFPKVEGGNHLGIQGFPAQWDIEEIADEKINENHRREINRLIEECCKVPPVASCNGNTFSGACK